MEAKKPVTTRSLILDMTPYECFMLGAIMHGYLDIATSVGKKTAARSASIEQGGKNVGAMLGLVGTRSLDVDKVMGAAREMSDLWTKFLRENPDPKVEDTGV